MRSIIEKIEDRRIVSESVADTILKQLGGGNRLRAMIGARDIFSDDGGKSLVFKFPNRKKSAPNYVKITLTSMDLYDIEFGRITMKKDPGGFGVKMPTYKKGKTVKGAYAEDLVDIFERTTGLYLKL
jgi:hypothetical protein